jgi:hypothetical protein
VHRDQVLPEAWLAFAYLKPDVESNAVRRGSIVELKSLVENRRATGWRVLARDGRYAQVAVRGREFADAIGSAGLDRPFKVIGAFTDREIASFVAYARSSPRKPAIPDGPDGTSHREYPDRLEGRLPVVQLRRVDRDHVEIWLADNDYSGQHAALYYNKGGWHIGEIGAFVS